MKAKSFDAHAVSPKNQKPFVRFKVLENKNLIADSRVQSLALSESDVMDRRGEEGEVRGSSGEDER